MTTIPQVAQAMQTVLTTAADVAACQTRFVQRQSKLTGAKFVQSLVFGWLANPEATLEELCQTAATLGVPITPQGLDQRFTAAAAACLEQVLQQAVEQLVCADPVAIPLVQRFAGVYLLDSTTVSLPPELANIWPGGGGSGEKPTAAVKLQVQVDVRHGTLQGPLLQPSRAHDRTTPLHREPLPREALRIADLGYFSLDRLQELAQQGTYWLTRIQAGTAVFDAQGRRWELATLLANQRGDHGELSITLGVTHRVPCRLLAQKVPLQVANQRRRRLHAEARRRGQSVSRERLALADWTIVATNVPPALLTREEALVLARVRWQIELLFKRWKSQGHIDEWRSTKPWRILCEVYAKVLAMLVQHWLLVVNCWQYPNRSLWKAAQTIRKHAWHLASVFGAVDRLCEVIVVIGRCLATGCRINKRKKVLHTYQLLLSFEEEP